MYGSKWSFAILVWDLFNKSWCIVVISRRPSKKDRSCADKPDFSAGLIAAVLGGNNVGVADLDVGASGGDENPENAVDVFTVGFVVVGGDDTSVTVWVVGAGGGGANNGKDVDVGRGGGLFDTGDVGVSYRIGDIGSFTDQLLAVESGGGRSGAGIGEGGAGQWLRLAAAFCVPEA
ncbi:hypothetical protein BU17DRAFT_66108 [Hysterangium stoloniferum]|nr:hypothetical protein BU17DRAFT_66108 [Hysterangium stoloniferum]